MWKLTLPNGAIQLFEDWESARIDSIQQGYRLGVILIPERVVAQDDPGPTEAKGKP